MIRKLSSVVLLTAMFLITVSCGSTSSASDSQIANPWEEYPSIINAVKHTKFYLSNAPLSYQNIRISRVADMDKGELSEVDYGDYFVFRKGLRASHISGDYNDYPVTIRRSIHGKQLSAKGESDKDIYKVFEWDEGLKYSCSIYARNGLTLEEWENLLYIFQ